PLTRRPSPNITDTLEDELIRGLLRQATAVHWREVRDDAGQHKLSAEISSRQGRKARHSNLIQVSLHHRKQ
ncbi:MAG: hypothetical protein Q8J78_09800, partial [Moraxellaceae bacterium]|nr:hypothetical protein [Moraxellaceae bacterium]